jgi:hypothetical protein
VSPPSLDENVLELVEPEEPVIRLPALRKASPRSGSGRTGTDVAIPEHEIVLVRLQCGDGFAGVRPQKFDRRRPEVGDVQNGPISGVVNDGCTVSDVNVIAELDGVVVEGRQSDGNVNRGLWCPG